MPDPYNPDFPAPPPPQAPPPPSNPAPFGYCPDGHTPIQPGKQCPGPGTSAPSPAPGMPDLGTGPINQEPPPPTGPGNAPAPGPGQTPGAPGTGNCPQPGQIVNAQGQCACPPGMTIHGNSGRGCEPEGGELCDPATHPAFDPRKGRIDPNNPEADCWWCNFETRKFERGYCPGNGAAGAGAAGAGGAKGAAAPAYGPSMASTNFAQTIQDMISADLKAPSRFTPEIMQKLYGQVTQQSANRIASGQRDVLTQAARAGRSSRWGSVQAGLRAVRAGAESARGQLNLNVELQKVNADYTDRQAALDRAQKYLDSMRDNEYRYTLLGEQRRQFDANLTLGYANLAQQRQNLLSQLQSQWDMMRALQGFLLLQQGA